MGYNIGDYVCFKYRNDVHIGMIRHITLTAPIQYVVESENFPFGLNISAYDIINKYTFMKNECNNYKKESDVSKHIDPYEIIDYKIYNNKVVVFTFADGTEERAVCDPKDKFDLERAVEVGIIKKKLGGSNAYNTLVKKAMNQIKAVDKRKAAEIAEAEIKAHRRQKDIERKIKRKEKKREEQIEIQKEAFLRAMQAYDECALNVQIETLS